MKITVEILYKFDGDEMNMHMPQSVEAATELREIAAVPLQIISPRESVPIVSVVQDTLVGANRFTRPNVLFTRKEAMNLLVHAKRWDGKLPNPVTTEPQSMWSGQQLLSALLPPVSMEVPNSSYGDEDKKNPKSQNLVKIYKGQIYQGILDKSTFSKHLLQVIYNDYGPDMTVDFLDSLQAMIANFLMNSGFSVGISDLIADEGTNAEIEVALQKLIKSVEDQILQLHTGLFENSSGRSNQEEFEGKAMSVLNKAVGEAGKIGLKTLADTNRMTNMVKAGSKGSDVNVSQMIGTLGQTAIEGKRVPNGFQHRTLPHFKRFDDSAQARGFITSSYIKGLQPDEFFFHAMSGREGLIDTAVKTADTGYLQRQIRVALEDLITQHDGSVRDATGNLLQLAYGEDGANATKLEGQPINLAGMSDAEIAQEFMAEGAPGAEQYINDLKADRKALVEGVFQGKPAKSVKYPVHLERTIVAVKHAMNLNEETASVTPTEVLEAQAKILERTHAHNRLWGALVRFHLSPAKLRRYGFTHVALDALVEQIVLKHWKSWVEPGQPVGVIAAQSIGEPCTQMSVVYDTRVVINNKTHQYNGPIGKYIDTLLMKHKESVVDLGGDSVVLDLTGGDAIVGVSADEKVSWLPIQQVSRHPANGGLVTATTRTGRKTTATLSHSFLKRSAKGIVPVLGGDLKIGDRIPVATNIPIVANPILSMAQGEIQYALDREFGWVCGMYVADGCLPTSVVSISKMDDIVETRLRAFGERYGFRVSTHMKVGEYGPNKDNIIHSSNLRAFMETHFGHGSFEKRVADFVYHAPQEFIAGFVGGYFDGDGNVNVERNQIRLSSRNGALIRDTNRLLGYLGMYGWMGEERSVRAPESVQHTLNLAKSCLETYAKSVGFVLPGKAASLTAIIDAGVSVERDVVDQIPELGATIAETGKLLGFKDQSRTYGRWAKKAAIGRSTLRSYIAKFNTALADVCDAGVKAKIAENIAVLESAAYSDVLWDEIVDLTYQDDPKTYVYDFTVPGNDSFMVDDNVLVHNTLNTFHLAGVAAKSNMTRGVPRMKELLKATKNPKAIELQIPLRRDLRTKKEEARRVAQELEFTLLQDIVTTARIYYDPKDDATLIKEDEDWLAYMAAFSMAARQGGAAAGGAAGLQIGDALAGGVGAAEQQVEQEAPKSPWILRFELDRERMFAKNITMDDIAFILRSKFSSELSVIYTDYNANRLVFRARLNSPEGRDSIDDLNALKVLQNKVLSATAVRGIPGLRSVNYQKVSDVYEFDVEEGRYKAVDQYVLISDGSNFLDVLTHPDVDPTRVVSSNIHDMMENLGIEATRATLFKEITSLFADSGTGVNYRHVSVLIDKMCHKGKVMSVDRYGINKNDIGPLAKMSFEQTEDIALRAAMFGERDPCLGVSAKVMLGAPIKAGTAFSELLFDETAAISLATSTPEQRQAPASGPGVYTEEEVGDMIYGEDETGECSVPEIRMSVPMPSGPMEPVEEEDLEDVEITIV